MQSIPHQQVTNRCRSLCTLDGNSRCIPSVPQPILELSILASCVLCQCMEWRRVLHRGLWQEVSCLVWLNLLILTMPPFRFERELEALRKEIAESAAKSVGTSGTSTPGSLSRGSSHTDLQALGEDSDSPEPVLPDTGPEFAAEPLGIKKNS